MVVAKAGKPANGAIEGAVGVSDAPNGELEHFLPVTKAALMDRLCEPQRWPSADAEARRFFRYLDYWRQQQYSRRLMRLLQSYEHFSPDTDLLVTRQFSPAESAEEERRVFDGVEALLKQANYTRIDPREVEVILTADSAYGLDLTVDLEAFERVAIYYRGTGNRTDTRRTLRRFGLKEEFDVPIFRRLCIVFKLVPFEKRVAALMAAHGLSRQRAEAQVRRARAHLPSAIVDGDIYLKLFRNIPHTDLEMVFPNTEVRFRLMDKLRLGATAGGGLGFGIFSSAGKIALLASNPLAAASAVLGIGGVVFRQAMSIVNQKQKYMVVMAQNLYFHAMADNAAVIVEIASRAAEEDVKEEWLLYAVLAKTKANRADLLAIDQAIERFLRTEFGIAVDFDVDDALSRLLADGVVTEGPGGALVALPPGEAARHIDARWDVILDNLPDPGHAAGDEFTGSPATA